MTLDVGNFLAGNPAVVREVGGYALAHVLYTYARRKGSGRSNRRQIRKSSNRKRRWFVDNIIMHHKRLHDRNREIVVGNVRARVMARKQAERKILPKPSTTSLRRDSGTRWREMVELKDRGNDLRNRVKAKQIRAKHRWVSLIEEQERKKI